MAGDGEIQINEREANLEELRARHARRLEATKARYANELEKTRAENAIKLEDTKGGYTVKAERYKAIVILVPSIVLAIISAASAYISSQASKKSSDALESIQSKYRIPYTIHASAADPRDKPRTLNPDSSTDITYPEIMRKESPGNISLFRAQFPNSEFAFFAPETGMYLITISASLMPPKDKQPMPFWIYVKSLTRFTHKGDNMTYGGASSTEPSYITDTRLTRLEKNEGIVMTIRSKYDIPIPCYTTFDAALFSVDSAK